MKLTIVDEPQHAMRDRSKTLMNTLSKNLTEHWKMKNNVEFNVVPYGEKHIIELICCGVRIGYHRGWDTRN